MFYLLHGDNELERSEQAAEFKRNVGDESLRDLNVTVLDGRKITLGEVQHAADAIPFLADRRLVIVEGLLTRLAGRKSKGDDGEEAASGSSKDYLNSLLEYLPRVSETTLLVFVEPQSLKATHPILKLAQQTKTAIEFKQPALAELNSWIIKRAGKHAGTFEPAAAKRLAALIGGDLRRLDQEIDKLITYVNGRRPVTEKDVSLLVADSGLSNIFDMVDALGKRDGQRAARELHQLLDQGENPLGLLAMIVRQFRLMIQVKELQEGRLAPDEIARQLSQHPFVVKKLSEQARNFSLSNLETIYRRLLDINVEIVTGQTPDVLALDLLVAGLAG